MTRPPFEGVRMGVSALRRRERTSQHSVPAIPAVFKLCGGHTRPSCHAHESFALSDRLWVAALGGWKSTFRGVVVSEPEHVETVRGSEYFYWVELDEPQ